MTAIELEYITMAYICPAALAVTIIICACALIGWRNTIRRNEELCAMVKALGKLAKLNDELRAECDGFKRDMEKLADKWEGK